MRCRTRDERLLLVKLEMQVATNLWSGPVSTHCGSVASRKERGVAISSQRWQTLRSITLGGDPRDSSRAGRPADADYGFKPPPSGGCRQCLPHRQGAIGLSLDTPAAKAKPACRDLINNNYRPLASWTIKGSEFQPSDVAPTPKNTSTAEVGIDRPSVLTEATSLLSARPVD